MKTILTIFICLFLFKNTFAQKYDFNWYTGYRLREDTLNPEFGITHWNFNTPSINPIFSYDTFKHIDFHRTICNISNSNGQYQFSYNGFNTENMANQPLKNGENGFTDVIEMFDVTYQSGVILPFGEQKYYIIHEDIISHVFPTALLYYTNRIDYSIVDMSYNAGLGIVSAKKINIIKDTLDPGRLIAIRHANGRDFWIIAGRYNMDEYYKILVSPNKVSFFDKQRIGTDQEIPFGGAAASPFGNKIVYYSQHEKDLVYPPSGSLGMYLHFFDFNRESGELSYEKIIRVDSINTILLGGCFSPNGRFFYLARRDYIYQIDLENEELKLDTIAQYDGYTEIVGGNFIIFTRFGLMEYAPDGRIYGTTSNTNQLRVFYINKPNLKGKACDLRQHAFSITTHFAMPTFPYFRLGPLDGSESDSLGIDNIPVAEFRYDQDTINFKQFEFTNLSWYEPTEFWWDYGDGSPVYYTTVWDTSITHIFPTNGVYNVCLKAKNGNGENTICKTLKIGSTGNNEIQFENEFEVFPNPTKDLLVINLKEYLPENMGYRIYNTNSELVSRGRIYAGSNVLDLENINSGIYFLSISEKGKIVYSSKLIKL